MPIKSIPEAIAAVQVRIRNASRRDHHWLGGYARGKVGNDWIFPELCQRIRPGAKVLDLGSGIGLLGLLLAEVHPDCLTHGIELDDGKVAYAQRLLDPDGPCAVRQGDIVTAPWPPADVVTIVDVLHYMPVASQLELLARVAAHLPPGGMLLLRVMDGDAQGMARFTRLLDRLGMMIRWIRVKDLHWRGLKEIQADLARLGFQPCLRPADAHLLDGNRLIQATKLP